MEDLRKKRGIFEIIKGILGFIQNYFKALIFLLIMYMIFSASSGGQNNYANLVRIDLSGVILESDTILKSINSAYDNDGIKGVLLVVNSPGGAVAPSIEISMAIKRLRDRKPVVAYAAGSMTSGSYYASSNANYIMANPGSMIGSIGVIMQSPNIAEFAKKIGISEQVVKAGEYKEAGTITREWTEKEKKSLQVMVDDIYDLFVSDIAAARKLDMARVSDFADAKVFIASKAEHIGLIDSVGSIAEAKEKLVELANVETPIWKEPDLFDKFAKRLASETRSQISSLFYGLKAY